MRNYRNTVAALALALVLSTSAFAGIIHTDKTPPPPPPTANGEIHTDATASTPGATDSVTEIALNLLQSVFSLF